MKSDDGSTREIEMLRERISRLSAASVRIKFESRCRDRAARNRRERPAL